MEFTINKDNILTCLMKTDEKHQIIGKYNKINQSYTGQLDGRKVTIALIGSIALISGSIILLLGTAGVGIFGVGFGSGLSAKIGASFTAITGMKFTIGIPLKTMGAGVILMIAGGFTLPKKPQPTESQLQHEKDLLAEAKELARIKRLKNEIKELKDILFNEKP